MAKIKNNTTNSIGSQKAKKTSIGDIFKFIFNEISTVIIAFVDGIMFIFDFILIQIPKSFIGLFSSKKNTTANNNGYSNKKLYQKVADNMSSNIDNMSVVQKNKSKKEANLKPIELNPEVDSIKSPTKQTYRYLIRNKEGKLVKGYFPAFSKMDIYSYLTDMGSTVYQLETSKFINLMFSDTSTGKTRMKTGDLIFWLTQLSTYIRAGIPLADAVKVIAQQDKKKKYKVIYEMLIYELNAGETFSEALKKQGNAFPGLLINMIKSSEMMGNIEDTLDEMAQYYQEIEDNKKDIISALAYPVIVMIFAVGIVIFLLTYIVPKFVDVYESMDAELNPITVITLNISAFLKAKWYIILAVIAFVIIAYSYSFKNIKAFRKQMQAVYMRLPVVGKIIISKELNMFARTFASLQKNNVLLTDSIEVLSKITNNEVYRELELNTIDNLIKGNKMSETFKDNWAIPDIAYFMIVTGESTGELAEMLDKVADFYQKQQKNATAAIKTFIEPVMIISLAVMVGFILIAILVPMFGVYSAVG